MCDMNFIGTELTFMNYVRDPRSTCSWRAGGRAEVRQTWGSPSVSLEGLSLNLSAQVSIGSMYKNVVNPRFGD